MEYVNKRKNCQNCGRPSHCGRPEYDELQNYDEPPSTLKICDHCRCGKCHNPEKDRK